MTFWAKKRGKQAVVPAYFYEKLNLRKIMI